MNESTRTALVRITGRVQGVWFRDWTRRKASALGLVGWVRNRADHSVEALFRGPSMDVEEMISTCHRGPPLSRVDEVVIIESDVAEEGDLLGFEIRF